MSVALVTGASSGIGRSAAIEIARRGNGVIVTYDKNKDGALDTIVQIEAVGGTAVALPLSVGHSSMFPEFRESVLDALRTNWQTETLDFLVNNAGFGGGAAFEETTEEFFDELTRVLLRGPYFLTQSLLPLLAHSGAIVNTASHSALDVGVEAGFSAYAMMKGGILVFTRYLAKELAPRGIRVNSVAPGPTRTRLGGDAFAKYPELIEPLVARTALGRLGEPDDIGKMIAVLLSADSAWVTGQNVEVSGGFRL
ncbi:MAG: hypothetical protein QOH03_4496 [Kribbellaceae bacterium]|nr:hypothetical protein [Kribbellaceae bacterium]